MLVTLSGEGLSISAIAAVARGAPVQITQDATILARVARSRDVVRAAIARNEQIYGVTTLFGGMADQYIGPGLEGTTARRVIPQVGHRPRTYPKLTCAQRCCFAQTPC